MDQTSKIPALVSALVCPGAGQFLQRRWFAGTFFMSIFLISFGWFLFVALRIIVAYYALASDIDATPTGNTGVSAFIAPLSCALIIYFLNMSDVVGFKRRIEREKREEAFALSMVSMMEARTKQKQPPEIPPNESTD